MARDNRIDTIKGLLIILVVLGHVITAFDNVNVINHGVMGLIYIFHMPLFILISGYLTKHPSQQRPAEMWKGVWKIALTLLVFQVIAAFRVYFQGKEWSYFFNSLLVFPFGVLWYLFSLICWRIMLYYTPKKLLRQPTVYLVIAIVVSLLIGLTHLGTFLSIQRTLNFYLFFLMGFYYRQGSFNTPLWHNNKLHIAVVVVMLPLLFWLFPRCGNVMNGADYYGIAGLPQKAMVLTTSISMSLLVFNLTRENKWLSVIGKDSLFYYVYHINVMALTVIPLVRGYDLPRTLPFIILYTAIAMAIMYVMSNIKLFRWFVHPTLPRRSAPSAN